MYKGYSLAEIPTQARPDLSKKNQGQHSYTLSKDGASVEILLRCKAFFVKRVGGEMALDPRVKFLF